MAKERNIVLSIILTFITCGIYGIYWFVVITDEAKAAAEDNQSASGVLALVFNIITCGIYGFYWAYKLGQNLSIVRRKNNMNADDYNILFIILHLVGLDIITYAITQNDLNTIATKNNVNL